MAEIKFIKFQKLASRLIKKKKTYPGAYVRYIEFQSFSCFSYLPNVRDENK